LLHIETKKQTLEEDDIKIYLSAFEGQQEERRNIRLTVVGSQEVGKTTFCWRLMKRKLKDSLPSSTDGMDIYINRFIIDMDKKERIFLESGQDERTNIQRRRDVILRSLSESRLAINQDKQSDNLETSPQQNPIMHTEDDGHNNIGDSVSTEITRDQHLFDTVKSDMVDVNDINAVMSGIQPDSPIHILKKAYASIWDCGGHKEFYNSHHIFLSSDSIYVLVFDVSKCLESKTERSK